MGRKRTGQRPGHPGKTRFIPVGIPKLTKRQWRALIHERRAPVPFIDIFGEIEPKPSLSTRDLRELVGVSSPTISSWRRNAAYQYGFRFASMKAFARKHPLGLAPPAPVTKRTKKQADDRLMTQQSSEQVDKKSNFVESPIGDDLDPRLSANLDPSRSAFRKYDWSAFRELIRRWKCYGSKKLQERRPGWFTRALFHGDKKMPDGKPDPKFWLQGSDRDQPEEDAFPDSTFSLGVDEDVQAYLQEHVWPFNIREQGQADVKVEFFKKGNVDCVRVSANPGLRTGNTSGLVQRKLQRKGKSVRRLIAKRGDTLEVYVGKATKEHREQYPSEWQAYLAAQRDQPTKDER